MINFFISLGIFLGSHFISSVPRIRNFFIRLLGERKYLILYSLVSLVTLYWLFHTAINAASYLFIWPKVYWTYWVPNIIMPFAFIIFVMGINTPNPLSILSKRSPFDPQKPKGIVAITRHPVLWSMTLWAFSHLFPNGSLTLVIVFSVFMVFSIMGMHLVDHRLQRDLGGNAWKKLSRNTSIIPFAALFRSRQKDIWSENDIYNVIIGLGVYYLFLNLHEYFLGIHPLRLILSDLWK